MEKVETLPLHKMISNAKRGLNTVEERRKDTLTGRVKLRDDSDWLLYSIANSLLAMVELKRTRGK